MSVLFVRTARTTALIAMFVSAPAFAQAVAVRDLPKPSREIEDPFSLVTTAIEIKPGQVLALDGIELELAMVDFAQGSKTAIGRQGSGPGEYRVPTGLFRLAGDTIWILDAAQQRLVAFNPDLTAGTSIPMIMFDQSTMTATSAPFFTDRKGQVYASAMAIQVGRGGAGGTDAQISLPDSVGVVKIDPRGKVPRAELARVRFPISGKPDIKMNGTAMKYTMAYPGLVASDPWTVFPDGRIAIVRGANYSVEFIAPDGKKSAPTRIAYSPIRVTAADQKAEMDEARDAGAGEGSAEDDAGRHDDGLRAAATGVMAGELSAGGAVRRAGWCGRPVVGEALDPDPYRAGAVGRDRPGREAGRQLAPAGEDDAGSGRSGRRVHDPHRRRRPPILAEGGDWTVGVGQVVSG